MQLICFAKKNQELTYCNQRIYILAFKALWARMFFATL